MDRRTERMKSMLFNNQTVTRNDYPRLELQAPKRTVYVEKHEEKPQAQASIKHLEIMRPYKKQVPFTLFMKKNEILHQDPREVQKPFVQEPDNRKEAVMKTRPRVVMTPAACLDDMDHKARALIVEDVYKSVSFKDQQSAAAEAFPACYKLRAPLPGTMAPARPVFLPKHQPPLVPDEWRMDSVKWDRNNLRSSVHPTKEFWLKPDHRPTRCEKCDETTMAAAQRRHLYNIKHAV